MDRPYLVNFSAIISENQLSIRASITDSKTSIQQTEKSLHSRPIQSLGLFSKESYRLKIVALNAKNETIFKREYDSDSFGRFEIKANAKFQGGQIEKLVAFETSKINGLDLYLGSFLPLVIKNPKKIIISDFDKTLVDTRYSTPKEMYYSLNKPLSYFPSVSKSIKLLNSYVEKGYQPFILSASPHFYEDAIRDWFYANQIFISNLYLKDYRDFISIFDGKMTTKDLKKQGFYKLNQLVDILLMTKIPENLVLIGDGFESDPFIYITLKQLLQKSADPWKIWNTIKHHNIFNLTSKQDSQFITKFYLLNQMVKKYDPCDCQIHIRATQKNIDYLKTQHFNIESANQMNDEVNYYVSE